MKIPMCFRLVLLVIGLLSLCAQAYAEDGVRFGDITVSLRDSRSAVTAAVLASKGNYSLRGGEDGLLSVLDATGALKIIIRFRDDTVVGIESVWPATSADEFSANLREIVRTFIGDTGSLAFDTKPNGRTDMRLYSGNVDISVRDIPNPQGQELGMSVLYVTIGERHEAIR